MFAVINHKLKLRVLSPKDAGGMVKSVEPDQTEDYHIGSIYRICPRAISENHVHKH